MSGRREYEQLSSYNQALVTIAVLIDGLEAAKYLEKDAEQGESLKHVAEELAQKKPVLRLPLLGTQLRKALSAVEKMKREVGDDS